MKRITLVGWTWLIAAIAVSAIGAVAASAEEVPPEYGRCLKAEPAKSGKYGNKRCTTTKGTQPNEWEWLLTLPKPGFALKIKPKTTVTFENVQGDKLVCTGATGTGEITNRKETSITSLTLTGCNSAGSPCTTAGQAAGTIVKNPFQQIGSTLGWLIKAKRKVGLDLIELGNGSEPIFRFECAAPTAFGGHGIEGIVGQGIAATCGTNPESC